ncbi:MAG: hypothetical protein Q8O03_06200 [Nanoarchaeota archaeon]|nr:hypothetical protein [Nanoarchaeota archaeon]
MRPKTDVLLAIIFTILILGITSLMQTGISGITGLSAGNAKVCVGNTPSLVDIGNLSSTTGTNFYYDVNHTISGSDSVLYSAIASSITNFYIKQVSGEINFTSQESDVGNHTITVQVNNSACTELGDMEDLNFEIIQGNRAPVLDLIENQTVVEDTLLTLTLYATDADGDNITYACNDTSYFTVNETTGIIEWDTTNADVGLHWFDCNATDDYGAYDSQEFFILVRNTNDAPILEVIPDFTVESGNPLYEDTEFYHKVNATDIDGDTIEYSDDTNLTNINDITGVITFKPIYVHVGNYSVIINAIDLDENNNPLGGLDQQVVLFEILAVNDPPRFVENLTAQTAKINKSFYLEVNASDEEDGTEYYGKLTFTADTLLFGINPTTGVISFTPTDDDLGNYTINISVTDNGMLEYGQGNLTVSAVISFTVTEANRPPNITDYDPTDLTPDVDAGDCLPFSVTVEDPDGGTPTVKWYLDEIFTNETGTSYNYCPSSAGSHNVTVLATDGELDALLEWAATVKSVAGAPGAGGGGGGAGYHCKELWVCEDWSTCTINDIQIRACKDLKECGTSVSKPPEVRSCIFTLIPSCFDRIRNQDEILPDCGGVCKPCPTCDDEICNQGELCEICDENPSRCPRDLNGNILVDCGGPCPLCPKIERVVQPKITNWKTILISITKISVIALLILLIILVIIIKIIRHISKKAVLTETEKTELELINKINDLVTFAEKTIDMKDLEQLKLACANIEKLYNSLSSTKNKKKIYPKIKKLKRAIRIGF